MSSRVATTRRGRTEQHKATPSTVSWPTARGNVGWPCRVKRSAGLGVMVSVLFLCLSLVPLLFCLLCPGLVLSLLSLLFCCLWFRLAKLVRVSCLSVCAYVV